MAFYRGGKCTCQRIPLVEFGRMKGKMFFCYSVFCQDVFCLDVTTSSSSVHFTTTSQGDLKDTYQRNHQKKKNTTKVPTPTSRPHPQGGGVNKPKTQEAKKKRKEKDTTSSHYHGIGN